MQFIKNSFFIMDQQIKLMELVIYKIILYNCRKSKKKELYIIKCQIQRKKAVCKSKFVCLY